MATEPRWLSPEERETWLSITELVTTLPGALDSRMQQHAGITFYEYMVMAMLSEQTDRTLQLSELAELTSGSLSRLSHVLTRLERHGWVERARSPHNPRARIATLTERGMGKVRETAPAHVDDVRELIRRRPGPSRSIAASTSRLAKTACARWRCVSRCSTKLMR